MLMTLIRSQRQTFFKKTLMRRVLYALYAYAKEMKGTPKDSVNS